MSASNYNTTEVSHCEGIRRANGERLPFVVHIMDREKLVFFERFADSSR